MKKLKIVFMGTPDFAVGSLKALVNAGFDIVGIITAPDKPTGRGQKIQATPVKEFAIQAGLSNILQPDLLKSPLFIEELKSLKADLFIVVAFRMLPEIVWSLPPMGTINLHASLLPNYRGAAPINWVLINGEDETGVTTFFIEKEIDTGSLLFSEKVTIGANTTAGELHDLLMETGGELLVNTIKAVVENSHTAIPQSELLVGHELRPAPKIFKDDCLINWNQSGRVIHNFIRGLSPYPAAWTNFYFKQESVQFKIFATTFEADVHNHKPGSVITDRKKYLKIAMSDGYLNILSLQMAGKKRVNISEYLHGLQPGDELCLLLDI